MNEVPYFSDMYGATGWYPPAPLMAGEVSPQVREKAVDFYHGTDWHSGGHDAEVYALRFRESFL